MITIVTSPNKWTPAYNYSLWKVSSDDIELTYFKVEILEATTDTILNVLEWYPSPEYTDGSYRDLSKILCNYVYPQLVNSTNIVEPITRSILNYRLRITEILYDSTTNTFASGDMYDESDDSYFVWYANLEKGLFTDYNPDYFVVNGVPMDTVPSRFLTDKPNYSYFNTRGVEMLYFIQQDQSALRLKTTVTYTGGTSSTNYTNITGLTSSYMYKLNLTDGVIGDLTSVDRVRVQLFDDITTKKSEVRTYIKKEIDCNLEVLNVIWSNSFGGFDTHSFIQPQVSVSSSNRNVTKLSPLQYRNDVYSNISSNIYNAVDYVIQNNINASIVAYSQSLRDDEARWMTELINSRNVYIVLSNGKYLPVNLKTNSYTIDKQKLIKNKMNQFQIEIELADGLIPVYKPLNSYEV